MSYKTQIEAYIKANKMRRTPERKILIERLDEMNGDFSITQLLNHATVNKISRPSVYFFVELLVKIGIVKIQERYVWNKEEKV